MAAFFATTTMIISIPSVVILTAMVITLHGASIRFNVPMLFALAFLPMFAIGGLTGLPLGLPASDIQLHDTYYVIGHFHYVVAPGTIFAIFAGIYFWFPKATGRMMNEAMGKMHFVLSFIFINVVFMPMFFQGLAGVSRRLADQTGYAHGRAVHDVARALGGGGDHDLGRGDQLPPRRVVLADPDLVVAQVVEPLDQLHVAVDRECRVLPHPVKWSQENAELHASVSHRVSMKSGEASVSGRATSRTRSGGSRRAA